MRYVLNESGGIVASLPRSSPRVRLALRARLAFAYVRLKYANNTPVLQAKRVLFTEAEG